MNALSLERMQTLDGALCILSSDLEEAQSFDRWDKRYLSCMGWMLMWSALPQPLYKWRAREMDPLRPSSHEDE